MGLLVEGVWKEHSEEIRSGRFVRTPTSFRSWITPDGSPGPSGQGGFAAEPGRYHLYVSLACPWAHRTVIFRKLKGLEDAISLSVVEPLMGWTGCDDTLSQVELTFPSAAAACCTFWPCSSRPVRKNTSCPRLRRARAMTSATIFS